jgi:hypothetical protein
MTITRNCATCAKAYDAPAWELGGRAITSMIECEPCNAVRREAHARVMATDAEDIRRAHWLAVCPPAMRETDFTLLSPAAVAVTRWTPSKPGEGIGVVGPTRAGKTRAAFAILAYAHERHIRVEAETGAGLGKLFYSQFDDRGDSRAAKDRIRRLTRCGMLLIDDIGKIPTTARNASELWSLIDHRMNHQLSTLWTADNCGEALAAALGGDTGRATVARLREMGKVARI